ncbi:6656_t:CDS:2, partial [Entrophospora sp. SA101]
MSDYQSLTTLIKRLEAATSRLEDLATTGSSNSTSKAATSRLEDLATTGSSNSTSSTTAPASTTTIGGQQPTTTTLVTSTTNNNDNDTKNEVKLTPALSAYDELIEGPLKNFLELSKTIGGLVEDQSHAVKDIFIAQRDFIYIASQSKKPQTSETFVKLIKPTQQALEKVCEYRENNRPSPFFNHLSTVSEGIGALGWVTYETKTAPFVGDLKDASQFYAHRVIKEFKDKDRSHVDWANSFILLLTELQSYVQTYHTTGLVWNPKGVDPSEFIGRKPESTSTKQNTSSQVGETVDMTQVFAELNRGEQITSLLKKVDKDQMTHKNPSLRASSTVGEVGVKVQQHKKGPTAPPKPASLSLKKPPKKELKGNNWIVEYYENETNIVIDDTVIGQKVYIFGCKNSTVQVKGKVNAVTIDSCQKTGLLIDSVVAAVDVVNCKSVQVQVQGKTPTIVVDKTDSAQLYLSPECLDTELFTAKSSSINVNVPNQQENGDYLELPIPEQIKTTINGGKLVSAPVEH